MMEMLVLFECHFSPYMKDFLQFFSGTGKVGPPHYDQIGRFMFIILPGARPGLGTQPSQEAPGVLRLETEKPSD